jgi:hypothetical protein
LVIGNKKSDTSPAFLIRKGEYITVPHDLHMRDPKYFKDPKKFDPERFLVQKEDGSLSTDMKTIRPYGKFNSRCTIPHSNLSWEKFALHNSRDMLKKRLPPRKYPSPHSITLAILTPKIS